MAKYRNPKTGEIWDSETGEISKADISLDPTDGMSGLDKFRAGMGKAFVDTGRGIGQLFGLVDQKDIDEAAKRDSYLMDTGAGIAGNIAGHVAGTVGPGMLLSKVAAIPKVASAFPTIAKGVGLIGEGLATSKALKPTMAAAALYSGLQPVTTDQELMDSELLRRGANALGGGLSSAVGMGIGRAIPAMYQGAKNMVQPLTAAGQEKLVGRSLNALASNADDVARSAAASQPVMQGHLPTLAEATQDRGIATLQRGYNALHPESVAASQTADNITLASTTLKSLAKSDDDIKVLESMRRKVVDSIYKSVEASKAKVNVRPALQKIDKTLNGTMALNKPLQGIFGDIRSYLVDDAGKPVYSPQSTVAAIKRLGWEIDAKDMTGQRVNASIVKQLQELKRVLESQLGRVDKRFYKANTLYKEFSKPINEAKVLNKLYESTTSGYADNQGTRDIYLNTLLNTLRDKDKLAAKAVNFKRAKFDNIVTGDNAQAVENIRKIVNSAEGVNRLGRSAGSNTAQNLATKDILRNVGGALGLPKGMLDMDSGLNNYLSSFLGLPYRFAQGGIDGAMEKALSNPQYAASIMRANPNVTTATPGLLSAIPRYTGYMPWVGYAGLLGQE